MDQTLRELIEPERPFGPISAIAYTNPETMRYLFNQDNLLYEEFQTHPTLVVGRRGSGKTAFLCSVYIDSKYKIIIELQAEEAFGHVIHSIESMAAGIVFVESVATLWDLLFWNTIFVELIKLDSESADLKTVKRYTSGLGLTRAMDPYNIMLTITTIVKDRGGDNPLGMIAEFVKSVAFNNVVFEKALTAAKNFMEDSNTRAIILLDALEDFHLDEQTMCHAVSGLLRCQGSFRTPGAPAELRCCVPSELFHKLMELSKNPTKDFQHQIMLHWHASELIKLAAQRYKTFLALYHADLASEFSHLDLSTRYGCASFWHSIFSIGIKNRRGMSEDPIAYILRHTQLLPRQLLVYLNNIAVKNLAAHGDPIHFDASAIVNGIFEREKMICDEIFNAYRYIHPGAREACKRCLRMLPSLRFTDGELHRAYNQGGGKTVEGVSDYEEFKSLLMEIGAIGRVTAQTQRYIIGLFEYTVPHKLITNAKDDLCVHPAFTEVFRVQGPENGAETELAVYPYGSDIDQAEYREIV